MSTRFEEVQKELQASPKTWPAPGAASFIGSNTVEKLLKLGQTVVGLDNFATGYRKNPDEVRSLVFDEPWQRFRFLPGYQLSYDVQVGPDMQRYYRTLSAQSDEA